MVRASLMILEQARAESPMRAMIRSRSSLHAVLRGQYFSIILLFIPALQKIPSEANLLFWISRAAITLAATAALDVEGVYGLGGRIDTTTRVKLILLETDNGLKAEAMITM